MFPAWRLHTQLAEEVAGFPAADVADECDSPVAVGDIVYKSAQQISLLEI